MRFRDLIGGLFGPILLFKHFEGETSKTSYENEFIPPSVGGIEWLRPVLYKNEQGLYTGCLAGWLELQRSSILENAFGGFPMNRST